MVAYIVEPLSEVYLTIQLEMRELLAGRKDRRDRAPSPSNYSHNNRDYNGDRHYDDHYDYDYDHYRDYRDRRCPHMGLRPHCPADSTPRLDRISPESVVDRSSHGSNLGP